MRLTFIVIFCAIQLNGFANLSVIDSVGIEAKEGKNFIKHVVEENETLYSLSRKYDVPIYKIIESNPPTEFGLEVGKVILIPILKKVVAKKDTVEPTTQIVQPTTPFEPAKSVNQVHIVEAKQTLFSISRMYDVSVADIKQWNNLSSNDLEIGQKLVVKQGAPTEKPLVQIKTPEVTVTTSDKLHEVIQSETLYSISRQYDVSVDDIKKWNQLLSNEISIGQQLIVGKGQVSAVTPTDTAKIKKPKVEDKKATIDTAKYNIVPETKTNFEEIVESGLAEQIEGSLSTRKYLAMHRKAKTGTIMKIRNEMNDQEVFVRIIGKLPDTGVNKNVVIKISKAAYDRLGAIDPKFRVTISYIP